MVKKALLGIVIIILVIVLAGAWYIRSIGTRALPDYNKNVVLNGVKDKVVIYRDEYGIPHIYARNESDLYLATGYVMAQDRLWQMDLIRRATTGRLAEIFGEDLVDTDLLMRALRIPEKSRMVAEQTDPKIMEAVQAFADGVNQYIEAQAGKLPPEFTILKYKPEPWKPEDTGNLIGYMAWDLTSGWNAEIIFHKLVQKIGPELYQELVPDIKSQTSVLHPDFTWAIHNLTEGPTLLQGSRALRELGLEILSGSNNWAVSGEKSATGKPILANDMHLGLFAPGIWMQMHQVVEGGINVTGVALPGAPFIISGHNDRIAWGLTNVSVDDLDFYLEKINPDNPDQYMLNGEWKDLEVRRETIKISGGQSVEKELRFTHRGPIVSSFKKVEPEAVSMRWVGNMYSNEPRTVYLLNHAGNWADFLDAVNTFISISQNIIYADVDGNIGLYCCAGVPMRPKGDGVALAPGWTDEYDWTGLVPFNQLPHTYNPPSGFVASANNKTVTNDYPYYISSWYAPPYRFDRIKEMLTARDKLSIEDFQQIQSDHKSKLVESMKGDILGELAKITDWNELEKQAIQILSSWDDVLAADSPAPSIFEEIYGAMIRNIFKDEMGADLYDEYTANGTLPVYGLINIWKNRASAWCDDISTRDKKETLTDVVAKSFKESMARLKQDLGDNPDEWRWGKIHQLTLNHPMGEVDILNKVFKLNRGPFEVGGSFHTVSPYSYRLATAYKVGNGASQRHIYNTADWDKSLSVIPTGASGIPASPHYCDQSKLYVEHKYHSDYISRELIEKNARYKMEITGGK